MESKSKLINLDFIDNDEGLITAEALRNFVDSVYGLDYIEEISTDIQLSGDNTVIFADTDETSISAFLPPIIVYKKYILKNIGTSGNKFYLLSSSPDLIDTDTSIVLNDGETAYIYASPTEVWRKITIGSGSGSGTSGYSGYSGYSGQSIDSSVVIELSANIATLSGDVDNIYADIAELSGGSGDIALDDLTDVATAGEAKNLVLKFNGSTWVPAPYDYSFTFSISSFDDEQPNTQLIGTGTWKATGEINFSASYTNGPPTNADITLTSDGGTSWASAIYMSSPFLSASSLENTVYPSTKDKYIRFTLTAENGEVSAMTQTVTFRNNIKFGSSTGTSWTGADIVALVGTLLSNSHTGSFAVTSSTGEYIIFAHTSTYTSIHANGFVFNSVTCPFQSAVTVSVTNEAGFTEDYKVYRSTNTNLGSSTLVTSTSSTLIDRIYWGITTKTDTYLESDVEGLASNAVSNTKGRTFTVAPAALQYILYALPVRLGTVTFFVGGFEGGFLSPETVSVTNVNGYTENYYVYRSTNSNLGSTTVTVV